MTTKSCYTCRFLSLCYVARLISEATSENMIKLETRAKVFDLVAQNCSKYEMEKK